MSIGASKIKIAKKCSCNVLRVQGVRKVTQLFNCSIRHEKINRSCSAIHHLKEQKGRFLKLQCMLKNIPPRAMTFVKRKTMSDTAASNSSCKIASQMFTIFDGFFEGFVVCCHDKLMLLT